ncbi:MAG: hypothetical protein M1816_007264 [Peltula sp. TS41687]|nr:MAG: hypothetical protein M1816_007264 [Peltula sp. TS41687]
MERWKKYELRELNAKPWLGQKEIFPINDSLDSSLKKNTAFIKRLRTSIASGTLSSFLQDIRGLSLHKYLSEIIPACYEGLCKLKTPAELSAGVEIVSALHQRFGPAEFTNPVGWLIGRGLTTPDKAHLRTLSVDVREKEERERLSRQRNLLKVVTELWLVGVLRGLSDVSRPEDGTPRGKENAGASGAKASETVSKGKSAQNGLRQGDMQEDEPFPLEVLKDLLSQDREHANLSSVSLFVRTYAWDVFGIKPQALEDKKSPEESAPTNAAGDTEESGSLKDITTQGANTEEKPMTSPELQQRFRNILVRYFDGVRAHLIREQKSLAAQARRNAEAYVKSGEIFEDRQSSYEKQTKAQEKLMADAQILSQLLGVEMPALKEDVDISTIANGGVGLVNTNDYLRRQGEDAGIWEDEEERRFYENLVDVKERVPGILLEDGKKKKSDGDDQAQKKAETKNESADVKEKGSSDFEAPLSTGETKTLESDDQSTMVANKTVGAKVDALLARLPDLISRDAIDEAAVEFCFLNSKASRNRLIKALQEIPRGRTDLFPPYARLIATLGKYMTDIAQAVVSYLDSEFRSLQRRKEKDFLGYVRTSNIRYLAELTKFGVVPEHVIFHCLKVSLDDFSRMNIEIICNLLENCGRYLLRNPETTPRMSSFLETLQRKKAHQHLGQQERMLIENAIYYVNPPERSAIQQKERTPVDLFIRKLVYMDMNKRNYTKILKQIRKLHWEDQEVVDTLTKVFTKPGKVKHSNVHLLAILAGALYRYHQAFVIGAVDDLLEYITIGLEQNDFRYNQRRISEVKYLGELYNYKMVDSPVIFDTLYRVITFGHEGGTPRPGRLCELDPPDDYFRIRLVCIILETCGMCFDRGAAKKKLDFFLTFFQYYLYTKASLPMDIEFLVQDTLSLVRSQWKLAANLEEASQKFAEAVSQNYKAQETEKAGEADESPRDTSSEGDPDEDESRLPELEDLHSSSEDVEIVAPMESSQQTQSDSDEAQIVVTRQDEERDPEAEAEFDRELAKLTAESLDSRKFDRKPMFDVPLPMRRGDRDGEAGGVSSDADLAATGGSAGETAAAANTMAFSLLTKKGNRQQTRTVELPANSHFAVAMKTQQQAEREEQKRIKNLVLNYDLRAAAAADDDHNAADDVLKGQHQTNNLLANNKRSNIGGAQARPAGNNHRGNQKTRRLQMDDLDWT